MADWVVAASIDAADHVTSFFIGLLAATLTDPLFSEVTLMQKLRETWLDAAEKDLVDISSVLALNIGLGEYSRVVPNFRDYFIRHAQEYERDSWLAIVAAQFLSPTPTRRRVVPPELDLVRVMKVADFNDTLDRYRATEFLSLFVSAVPNPWDNLVEILMNDPQKIRGNIGSALWPWILKTAPSQQTERIVPQIIDWIRLHPGDVNTRGALIRYMKDVSHPLLAQQLDEALDWLGDGTGKESVGSVVLSALGRHGSPETAIRGLRWGTGFLAQRAEDRSVKIVATALVPTYHRVERDLRAGKGTGNSILFLRRAFQVITAWQYWVETPYKGVPDIRRV